jgi:hypothetical protein
MGFCTHERIFEPETVRTFFGRAEEAARQALEGARPETTITPNRAGVGGLFEMVSS